MFTKPAGDDNASPVISAFSDGADRIKHTRGTLEQSFGLKVSLKGLALASIVAFYVLRSFLTNAHVGNLSVELTAAALLIGYPAILLMGKIQRHREAEGALRANDTNAFLRLLHPVMWLAGRRWGTVLLLLFWPVIFVFVHTLIFGLMPILLGAAAFWLFWTLGNRFLVKA